MCQKQVEMLKTTPEERSQLVIETVIQMGIDQYILEVKPHLYEIEQGPPKHLEALILQSKMENGNKLRINGSVAIIEIQTEIGKIQPSVFNSDEKHPESYLP